MKAEIEYAAPTGYNGGTVIKEATELTEKQFYEIWKTARWRERPVVALTAHGKRIVFGD